MRLVLVCCLGLLLSAGGLAAEEPGPELHFLTEHSPPAQYLNETGEIDGVTIALIRHLQTQLDERLRFTLLPWARAMRLASQQPILCCLKLCVLRRGSRHFQWVGPIKFYDMQLYALPEVVAHADDFNQENLLACAYRSSAQVAYFKQLGFEAGRNLSLVANAHECVIMAERGRADVIAMNALRYGEFHEFGELTLQRWKPLYQSYLYLAFSNDIPKERVQRWQQALQQSYLDGTMRRLYQEDYPEDMIEHLETYWDNR